MNRSAQTWLVFACLAIGAISGVMNGDSSRAAEPARAEPVCHEPACSAEPYCRTGWWNSLRVAPFSSRCASQCASPSASPCSSPCSSPCCVVQFELCCDDYCRKPCPRIPCRPTNCECDDFCRRPEPCVPRPCLTCVDDYCRKPLPRTCWPMNPHTYCIPYCSASGSPEAGSPSEGLPPVPAAQRPRVVWVR